MLRAFSLSPEEEISSDGYAGIRFIEHQEMAFAAFAVAKADAAEVYGGFPCLISL